MSDKQPKRLSSEELLVILRAEERMSVGYFTTQIAKEQQDALKYYLGQPFGDEVEGRSQVVSRDVAEVVDWMIPACMRVFLSTNEAVRLLPNKAEDEPVAELATAYLNHVFYTKNKGFMIVHDTFKTAFIQKIGVMKVYWEQKDKQEREEYEGLTVEEAAALSEDESIKVIEATVNDETQSVDMVCVRTEKYGCIKVDTIPPEEFLISAKSKSIDEARYTAQRCERTLSDLVEMGFSKKKVYNLAPNTDEIVDEREQTRFLDENYTPGDGREQTDKATEKVWVLEEYVRCDYDGDGIAELRQIIRVGDTILSNEMVEDHPWVIYVPSPIPHKVYGQGLADKTMDLQHINSTLFRQSLDNIYLALNPQKEVPEMAIGEYTLDDLLTSRVGGMIRTTGGGGMLREIITPDMTAGAMRMLDHTNRVRQQRTGITETNQGLGSDTLNPTMGGAAMVMDAANEQKDFYVRNFAETCMTDLFKKMLRLLVKHQDWEVAFQLKKMWVEVNPKDFDPDMDVEVQVGLGTGNKQARVQNAMALIQLQSQGMQLGMCGPEEFFNSAKELTDAMNLKRTELYFKHPSQIQQQPQQPDPDQVKLMQEAEIKKAELAQEMQIKQAELAQEKELELARLQSQETLKREQIEAEIMLKREQFALEAELSVLDADTKIRTTSSTRLGGEPG